MKAKSLYPSPTESRCVLAVSRGRAFCNGFPAELPAASKGRTTARPSPPSRLGVPERASKERAAFSPQPVHESFTSPGFLFVTSFPL